MDHASPIHLLDMKVGEMSRLWNELEEVTYAAVAILIDLPNTATAAAVMRQLGIGARLDGLVIAATGAKMPSDWILQVQQWSHVVRETLAPRRNLLIHGSWQNDVGPLAVELHDRKVRTTRRRRDIPNALLPLAKIHVDHAFIEETSQSITDHVNYLVDLLSCLDHPDRWPALRAKCPQRLLPLPPGGSLLPCDNDG